MKIGLYDIDSLIPNLALMKLSAFHKAKGDQVEFYAPLFHSDYDKIYASKIFTFSKNGYLRKSMVSGGSGISLEKNLPEHIEHLYPDYSLYGIDYAMGFISRGCIRKCPFCIVPDKEGGIRKNAGLEEFCKEQKQVMLLDNNILAYKNHLEELEILRDSNKKIDFNQGLDIRLINESNAQVILDIKRWQGLRYKFAFDNPKDKQIIEDKLINILFPIGFRPSQLHFLILIGFNTTPKEDLERVQYLWSMKISVFVMPYNKFDLYQKRFARWVNRYFYKYETFEDYIKGVRR